MLQVSQLYIYPIKSVGGYPKQTVELVNTGFKYDRRWMLVDEQNIFLTQRILPQMALLQTAETENGIRVSLKKDPTQSITIPFNNETVVQIRATIWGDVCDVLEATGEINDWFSKMLQLNCRLVHMPDDTKRYVDKRFALHDEITSFSDGYPILMIEERTLHNLNEKLTEALPFNRFRPNLVITGGHPHIEDEMASFEINGINFLGVKPCSRCIITTINQHTAQKGIEPLKTLAGYRMKNNNIYFGQNVLHQQNGPISVGDTITIIKMQKAFI
jgi:uncharacterized protein